ncbi:hypothetical protein ACQU0X_08065 [Pseudovibrio ascidiaceicola]|uniref:Uncharacterized protein n=1 Tax=Pseudovibrio ascidiaceicola TaxID=285279 RepID=A0A1I4CDX9_9HYPH|nr:hypothetical protein [Pseudovibrio ascidiaceicola]SFK79408.1 hypothetical protein SAMN04488518_109102 [Pseudovibrio ascidiaceicola]
MALDGESGEILLLSLVNAVPGSCTGSGIPNVTGRLIAAMQIAIKNPPKAQMSDG